MKQLLLLAALVSPAAAQIAARTPAASYWSAPVSEAIYGVVSRDEITRLGSPALSRLSLQTGGDTLALVAAPALEPLAGAIQAQGVTLDAFHAMPLVGRLEVLAKAAKTVEARAAAKEKTAFDAVARLLNGRPRPIREDEAQSVQEAEALAPYLEPAKAWRLDATRVDLIRHKILLAESSETFARELAARVAAGEFSHEGLLARDEDGWRAADEDPAKGSFPLTEILEGRLLRMRAAPAGPWTKREALLLSQAVSLPEITAALEAERPGSSRIMRAGAYDQLRRGDNWQAFQPRAARAIDRIQSEKGGSAPAYRSGDFGLVERYYARAAEGSGDATARAWVLASLRQGGLGLPPWPRYGRLKDDYVAAAGHRINQGLLAVGLTAVGWLAAFAALPHLLAAASGAAVFAALFVILNLIAAIRPDQTHGRIGELMGSYFAKPWPRRTPGEGTGS